MRKQRDTYRIVDGKIEKIDIEEMMPEYIILRGNIVNRNDKDFERKLALYDGPLDDLIGSDYDTVLHNRVKKK